MISSGFLITYLLLLMLMIFCYSRIVYTLRKKVTFVYADGSKCRLITYTDAETETARLQASLKDERSVANIGYCI